MAHKKGVGSSKNGRDSNAQYRGIKAYGGEFVRAGGIIGQQLRATFNAQPVTAFGRIDRPEVYARKLRWVFAELELTGEVALQLIDNALPRRGLFHQAEGREELLRFRRLAAQELVNDDALPALRVPEFL